MGRFLRVVGVLYATASLSHAGAPRSDSSAVRVGSPDASPAYRHLRQAAAGFHGPVISVADSGAIVLGVLAPVTRIAGRELLAAAQMAVAEVNAGEGIDGRPCRLVHLSDDQPWQSTAHQVARLIRDDGAVALIGGLDGGRAHTAELVVAKLWVPLVSPTAADRSVDAANVPWVFRLAPDEIAQARALVQHARARDGRSLRLVVEGDRQGRLAVAAVRSAAAAAGVTVRVDSLDRDGRHPSAEGRLEGKAGGSDQALLLWTRRETARRWLQARPPPVAPSPLLLPLHLVAPEILAAAGDAQVWGVSLSGDAPTRRSFARRWRARHGAAPSSTAALSYDATRLILAALAAAGPNPADLRAALSATDQTGVTGALRFDELGGRSSRLVIRRLQVAGAE